MISKNKETFTITAALPYANGPIHIGHLSGVYIPADIYARYKRITNNDVAFICGSDEHGVAISLASKKASITPKELIDKYDKIIKSSFQEFGIFNELLDSSTISILYCFIWTTIFNSSVLKLILYGPLLRIKHS